jgi:hypothetical protein
VPGEERRQALGHPLRVLQVEQVRRAGQLEELGVRKPGEQQLHSLYHLLTVELGWSADRHRTWLTDLMTTELLGPDAAR